MSLWKITTVIETDDEGSPWTEQDVRDVIQRDANRGEGLYIDCDDQCVITQVEEA